MTAISPKKTNPWPLLIVTIGLAFITVTAWSLIQAHEKASPITDPAYYSHGLRYNQTTLEKRAAESSGWEMGTELAGRRLKITLENGEHRAVSGCRGELVLYDTAANGSSQRLALPVREEGKGVYNLDLPPELQGSLTGDLSLQRDGARFNHRLLINL